MTAGPWDLFAGLPALDDLDHLAAVAPVHHNFQNTSFVGSAKLSDAGSTGGSMPVSAPADGRAPASIGLPGPGTADGLNPPGNLEPVPAVLRSITPIPLGNGDGGGGPLHNVLPVSNVVPDPGCQCMGSELIQPAAGSFPHNPSTFSEAGVRYYDGAVDVKSDVNLSSHGFSMPWGFDPTWTNLQNFPIRNSNGNGIVDVQLPYLVQAPPAAITRSSASPAPPPPATGTTSPTPTSPASSSPTS